MATYTPRPGSKIEMIINHMKANADKPMDVVCTEMLEFVQTNMADVRSYYRWAVKNDIAPGVVVGGRSAPKSTPKPKQTMAVPAFLQTPTTLQKKAMVTSKSDEELARIKAANLEKMREISAKMKTKRVVEINDDKDEEVEERDMFAAPERLTMDQLKALV